MEVNIGYAWAQLARAIETGHAVNESKWRDVIDGLMSGTLHVGSRTPTSAPAWVTLDVVTGGFATGGYSAAGPLTSAEVQLAADRGVPATLRALNLYFATAPETLERLGAGTYRIDLPEHGALLVLAWLRARGQVERASVVMETIAPWFDTLRFFPRLAEAPLAERETVRLQDTRSTLAVIETKRRQLRFEAQRDAILAWRPLWDRALATLRAALADRIDRDDIAALRAALAKAPASTTRRAREATALIEQLARFDELDDAERRALTHLAKRNGIAARPDDSAAARGPLHSVLREILVERMYKLDGDGGIDLDATMAAVTAKEATKFEVSEGDTIPAYFEPKLARSWDASLEQLVERHVIPSGESFAKVLPQVTGIVRARTIADAAGRRLYHSLYTAFRRRRGLLLLHYQNQVRFHELPWAAALEEARGSDPSATSRAKQVVTSTSALAIRAFPQTITPNKLVTELSALGSAAELKLPLVEELAADIFMGAFTAKFVLAAHATARVVANTLYQRYYAIDVDELAKLPIPSTDPKAPSNQRISLELAALCKRRAPSGGTSTSHVAYNGTIIEQSQILTTHNLSVLFDALPLRDELAPHLRPAADACFAFVVDRLRARTRSFHDVLINLKNAAYAWRQMVFYLSFVDDVDDFLLAARIAMDKLAPDLRDRFEPAIYGLELAASGIASNEPAFTMGTARVFLGWTTEHPWLAPPKPPR